MRNIWMLTAANLRKGKSQLISMVGLILLAALFLNLGLLFMLNLGKFYMERVEAQNAAHSIIFIEKSAFEKSDEEYVRYYPGVQSVQIEECIFLGASEFNYSGSKTTMEFIISNFDAPREMTKLKFIGNHIKDERDIIYLPYTMKTGGYKIGDEFTFTYQHKDYSFTVGGFVEELFYGSTLISVLNVYLPNDDFERFSGVMNDRDLLFVTMAARLKNVNDADKLISDYVNYIADISSSESMITVFGNSITEISGFRTMIPNMIALILVAFSAIIVFVCLIVIRFRIVTNIQDGMTNIGALKAVGYTSRQIVMSTVLQFSGIAAIASIFGILLSFAATPVVSSVFAGLIGLDWQQGFDPVVSLMSFTGIVGTVILVSLMATKSIHSLHPIIALRGGMSNQSFKKNFFPLSGTFLNLHIALAVKGIVQNLKQNLMIAIILIGVSFTCMFSVVMYYNFAVDGSKFMELGVGEPCNVAIYMDENNDSLLESIRRMPEVTKAFYANTEYSNNFTTLKNEAIYPTIIEDYSLSENKMILEGRYPIQADEIAFPGVLAKKYGISIGDTVEVKFGNKSADFLVSGITQSINNMGRMPCITLEGMQRLQKSYKLTGVDIFLKKGENADDFIDLLGDEFGEKIVTTVNVDALVKTSMGTFVSMTVILSFTILVTTVLIVVMVLYLIIKTNISRKKREIGIQKAIGYSTFQLMNQTALGLVPVILFGAGVGAFAGLIYINSVLTVLFSVFGIMRMDFYIGPSWLIIITVLITAFSYCVSMLISWRIRNISPYILVSE